MKKLISLIAAAAMVSAVSGATIAADNNPAVYVDGREIFFDDQAAVIKDDRTLVPARGVFEAMGAKVEWDGDKRQVQVTSADEQTLVRLVIDDADMKVYDMSGLFAALVSGQDFHAPETVVTLDVPAQIMNDRTMVPLRAISEAVDAQVDWNGEAYCVDITTKSASSTKSNDDKPAFSLSTSSATVAEGENLDLYINVSDIPESGYVGGVSAAISYDANNFVFTGVSLVNDDAEVGISESNDQYSDNLVRVMGINIDATTGVTADGAVMKLTFKSINGKEGSFAIVDGYTSDNGLMTYVQINPIEETDDNKNVIYKGDNFRVDTTPVVVNAGDAEATAEPEATTAPEATEAPEATAEPTATPEA